VLIPVSKPKILLSCNVLKCRWANIKKNSFGHRKNPAFFCFVGVQELFEALLVLAVEFSAKMPEEL
jgi:hypothetical protein